MLNVEKAHQTFNDNIGRLPLTDNSRCNRNRYYRNTYFIMKTKKLFHETVVGKILLKVILPIFFKKQKFIKTDRDRKNVDDIADML